MTAYVVKSKQILSGVLQTMSICRLNTNHFCFLVCLLFKRRKNFKKKRPPKANVFFLFFYSSFPLLLHTDRVVDKLPGANKLLLQHLVCVLHHILESADINKMDASNLAVCIAPTLLQMEGTPLDEQKEKIEKVESLVMSILSHFWSFEALWFTVQKTSRGFISKITLAQTLVCCLFS